ncbi:universal stress protein [Niastella caeni]|uniref:Universal stress protein n=1 Tax=Niastella caeni TaxID=2569763 RepID=A0A4V4GYZ7_9BACT|nr:universal stress protein [Niastella caeni]THU30716.1 universal stress protein [Niastella caeni]
MEKVIVAVDANQVNIQVLDFACFIAKLTHSKLIGIFLGETESPEMQAKETITGVGNNVLMEAKESIKQVDKSIYFFKEACRNRATNCSVHFGKGEPVVDIIKESRFADLLIVDPEMSFRDKKEGVPSAFIKEVLSKSECPVLIPPFRFDGIDEILFAYDGSPSSVFAIKQFTYLFPELTDKKLIVLEVNENDEVPVIEKEKIGELLQMHFSAIGFKQLRGDASNELFSYLLGKKNIFVVMGAFGRSNLSAFFKHSTAELLLKTINLPVFIAHH